MNKEDIIRMAQEAGLAFDSEEYPEIWQTYMYVGREEIERFAALVASAERELSVGALRALNETYECELHKAIAAEREECAKVCELEGIRIDASYMSCAKAIRARGQV